MERSPFAMWGWLLQRVTGVLLVIGMFVHYLYLHFISKGHITFEIVTARLNTHSWVFFDICLLAIIIYHAVYGLLGILTDCNLKPATQKTLNYLFGIAGILLFFYGFIALLTFHYKVPVI